MAITDKQKLFAKEYLLDLNATQAAIRAGYSPKSAMHSGKRNLQRPEINAEIQSEMQRRAHRCDVTADRVIKELARIAFADPSKIMKVNKRQGVHLTPTDELDEDHRRCVSELAEGRQGIRIKLNDKVRALELLGKHLGMFIDRMEMTGQGGGPVRLQAMTDEELEEIAGGDNDDT